MEGERDFEKIKTVFLIEGIVRRRRNPIKAFISRQTH
jgi:hypothetical protein